VCVCVCVCVCLVGWELARVPARATNAEKTRQYEKTEDDLKALQSVGQIIGEVLRQLTDEKFIVKASNGPRYVVGCRRGVRRPAYFVLVLPMSLSFACTVLLQEDQRL
jgi:hypothetical protein